MLSRASFLPKKKKKKKLSFFPFTRQKNSEWCKRSTHPIDGTESINFKDEGEGKGAIHRGPLLSLYCLRAISQDNDPRKMYYANSSPRQTLFSRGARSRRGEKRCQRTLFFVEIEARRQRIIARKGEFIIDDAQNRRKIYRDKQAREAERIETGRET